MEIFFFNFNIPEKIVLNFDVNCTFIREVGKIFPYARLTVLGLGKGWKWQKGNS
jgi:hypothetical protein